MTTRTFGYLAIIMNYLETLDNEISTFGDILLSVAFTDITPEKPFLKIYNLNYHELNKYVQNNPFPIDSNKLLKLCISLGNLIKSLQLDEEMYSQQQEQQQSFNQRLGISETAVTSSKRSSSSLNPFESPKHYINSQPFNNQPLHQIKFIKNLLAILKNFDIGYSIKDIGNAHNSGSSTTLNQYLNSPIKLNSKQLLIEKLEINIKLDTLFILKTLIKIIINVLEILKSHMRTNYELGIMASNNEQSSIFSSNSNASTSSESFITIDEYVKILKQIVTRISNGLTEPLLKYMLTFVSGNISNEFKSLVTSL